MAYVAAPRTNARRTLRRVWSHIWLETVTLLGAGVMIGLVFMLSRSAVVPTIERPSRFHVDQTEAQGTHVNELGGYSFDPPSGWVVRDHGSVSELISPGAGVVVSFGVGQPGALPDAASGLLDSIRDEYQDVRVGAPARTQVDHRPAVAVAGDLRNDAGVRVRFFGIATRVAGETRVIAVFVSQPAPAHVPPVVERVISSFEAA
jgi:hypothetical protein